MKVKRYVLEMENDIEKRFPDKAERLVRIRNGYLIGLVTEIEAVRAFLEIITEGKEE